MESVLGRYRNLIVLVLVLFAQVLGLAVQVKRGGAANDAQDTRLIRIWAVGALSPFERSVVWIQNSSRNLWHNYFYLRGVRAENRQLKEQIEQMRLEQVRLSEDAAQARRLQNLLAFKEQFIAKTVAAQVIGSSGSDLSRIVYIDKGEDSGIKRDMAVMTADGIVGKVLLVYPSESQVLLISDQSSGVGAILEKSRLQGVLRGAPNGEVTLERVMSDEQVQPGETVLTSGGDQIFPKGLPIGSVTKVAPGKDLFLNIKIKPAADLSKLEEVLVLVEKQERQSFADVHERVRAADILAQRLPSVPDKPAVDPNAPATASNAGSKPANGGPGTASTKPATNASTTPKPNSGVTAQSAAKKEVVPGQQASGSAPVSAATKTAKPVNSNPTQTDSAKVQPGPAIVEEKPSSPVPAQPKSQTPVEDNSPQ
ncbi:MAG TPA: rod shape-determining protein MreC [Candidatus Eisenbacteria bacterium]|nr:rod shape-determining protein MreC [Candidatus Eisenbacteria bacterium]